MRRGQNKSEAAAERGHTAPVDVPSGWNLGRIGDVAPVRQGSMHRSRTDGVIAFVPMALLPDEALCTTRWQLRQPEDVRSGTVFHEGDVLLAKITPCLQNGKLGIARGIPGGWGVATTEVFPLVPRHVTPEFLALFLKQKAITMYLASKLQGATGRQRLPKDALHSLRMPVPPLAEQRAIAEVLLVVQRAKDATEKVIAALRELKKGLLKYLFTYGPIPFNQADKVPLKETEIGLVPEHWSVGTIGDFATQAQYGLSLRGERKGQYPILRMNNLQEDSLDTQDLQYVNLDPKTFAKFRLHAGDVLFNRTNSFELVGKTAVFALDGDYVFASYLVRLGLAAKRLRPALLNYYVNMGSTQARLKTLASRGVSQSNINATKLKGFSIPVPPPVEQDRTVAMLRAAESKMAAEKARRETLEGLFRTLLHNLMTGKVRLRGFGTASPSAGG